MKHLALRCRIPRPDRSVSVMLTMLAASAGAQARVWVVTSAPSGLQSAIDSATSGDTVLVKTSGNYAELLVDGKALTVIADVGVQVSCEATVQNLAASQRVCLRGLSFIPADPFDRNTPGLRAVNDQGTVSVFIALDGSF